MGRRALSVLSTWAGLVVLLGSCAPKATPAPAVVKAPPAEAAIITRLRACTPGEPEICNNATDDDCNGLIDEGCGLQTGAIHIVAAWREPAVDVDLRVFDPKGHWVQVGQRSETGLLLERDCPGRNDECRGINVENIYLDPDEPMIRGTYRVQVRLEKLSGASPPIIVRLGARLGPKSFAAVVELHHEKQEESFEWQL